MAAITPLTSFPANGVTPAGTLTCSSLQGRLTAYLTSSNGGSATLRLITMTEGGNWGYAEDASGAPLPALVVSSTNSGDNVQTMTFDNAAVSTKYHVLLNGGSSAVSCWISSLTDPGTSTALVAHASTHLSGGSDDLLGSPGNVGNVTPGAFSGTFGPDGTHQNTVPTINGDVFVLRDAAQTLTNKTLTAPVINGLTSASGNADFSGSTGTFKTSTGAVTIGGGAAAITLSSSAAAINATAGAASTIKTTAGVQNIDGFAGVNFKTNTTLVGDIGATSATKLTMAAGNSYSGAAGAGGLDFGNMTGDSTLPTGSVGWSAAAGKTLSLLADGAAAVKSISGALTLAGATASSFTTTAGALSLDGGGGVNLKIGGATIADAGVTTAANFTLAANKTLAMAAGTGGISAGSATGATAMPTGNLAWTGAAGKTLALAADGAASISSVAAGVAVTGGGASSFTTSAGALTLTSAAAATWSTAAGALTTSGAGGINLQRNGATLADVGVTSATAVTIAANINLVGAAGTGAVTLGSMTGDTSLPTGAVSWAGAANKNLSLVAQGTGTVTVDNATTWSIGATNGTTGTIGRSGQALSLASNVTFNGSFAAGASAFAITDPGNAGAIPVTVSGVCNITTAAAETRTLAAPTFIGQRLNICMNTDGGDCVITVASAFNQAANTLITLNDAGDSVELVCCTIAGTRRWRLVYNDGATLG